MHLQRPHPCNASQQRPPPAPPAATVALHNSASAAPQNQLQLAECTCRKSCVVGCDALQGVAPKSLLKVKVQVQSLPRLQLRFAIAASAKSIAACRMHLQKKLLKNLHGGLQGATRG